MNDERMRERATKWREANVYKLREGVKTWPLTADEFDDYLAAFASTERDLFTKTLDLVATDNLFVQSAEGGGWVFWVNVNDMFYPAADGEGIDISEIPAIWEAWKESGRPGVVRWVQEKRGRLKLRKSREERIVTIEALQKRLKEVAAELDAATKEATEQACKAICENCRNMEDLEPSAIHNYDGKWKHKVRRGRGSGYFTCEAAAIRSRVAAQEKP